MRTYLTEVARPKCQTAFQVEADTLVVPEGKITILTGAYRINS